MDSWFQVVAKQHHHAKVHTCGCTKVVAKLLLQPPELCSQLEDRETERDRVGKTEREGGREGGREGCMHG